MAHKSHTQTGSKEMRKIRNTTLIKGIYYLNIRYPSDLAKAGLVEGSHHKKSLGTRDFREARKRAANEEALFWSEMEHLRSKGSPSEALEASSLIKPFQKLSKALQRDFVLKCFVEMERSATKFRDKYQSMESGIEKTDLLEDQQVDLFHFQTKEEVIRVDWEKALRKTLEKEGIAFDEEQSFDWGILELFKKATIEVQWRTVKALDGEDFAFRDREFKNVKIFNHSNEKPKDSGRTLGDLCTEFLEGKEKSKRSAKTMLKYTQAAKIAREALGGNYKLSRLEDEGYEIGKGLVEFLAKIPTKAHHKYKGVSLKRAATLEAKKTNPNCLSPKSQNTLFIVIKAIFTLGRNLRWIKYNPLDGVSEYLPKVEIRPRQVFTGEELTTLFSSKKFLSQRFAEGREMGNKGRFWTVLLCLFHGMRLNEAASLLISDVKQQEGIWFLDLSEFDENGNRRKRLKTNASSRRIPLHKEIIAIGFLDYVDEQRAKAEGEELFPDLKSNATGNNGASVSQWFTRTRNQIIGKPACNGDKSIHSFRHAVADAIREVTESDEILYAICGWGSNGEANSSRRYGRGSLARLKKVIDQIQVEGFDPTFLRSGAEED
ncbi:MAG: site-specific integrase [Verrucomicrobiota bacterium]